MKSATQQLALSILLFAFTIIGATLNAQDAAIEAELKKAGTKTAVYKTTEDAKGKKVELNIYIFNPSDHKATDSRPAVVFFFGGGWNGGKPTQFTQQCKYLASRGMVAMTADYRVKSRQGTKAISCINDAKSAVRWIRSNAKSLGVNPDKIASGGGSAGGHVAACTGVISALDDPKDDTTVSSVPNAMILFNPALVLAPIEENDKEAFAESKKFQSKMTDKQTESAEKKLAAMESRMGTKPKDASPYHNIANGAPPTIVFHGKADKTVPYWTAKVFEQKMKKAGNECQLVGYENQGHGFFNFGRKNGKYDETVKAMDKFLVDNGFLSEENETQKN